MLRRLGQCPFLLISRGIRGQVCSGAKPRRRSVPLEQQISDELRFPLVDDQLQRLVKESNLKQHKDDRPQKTRQKEPQKIKSKNNLKKIKPRRNTPLTSPVTCEDQHQLLAQVVTPLCQVPYYQQLKMKEHQTQKVLQVLSKRLTEVRAPVVRTVRGLPCPLEPTRPSPDLIAYRNKDEFGIRTGVDGDPKTVGFFVGRPSDPLMVCVPPTYLINMKESHKFIVQSFQNYIRQSAHDACHQFDDGGIWRNITVRSTQSGDKMACVVIHPQQLPAEGIQEVMEDLRRYFFEGEGSECELDSLYLQACKHTRCTREQAPLQLVAGKEHITETCCDLTFQISPDAFFQINTRGAEVLYRTLQEIAEVSPITTLLDICCGTGTISLVMAPHVRGTVGIDEITGAIEDAKKNAYNNSISNTTFIQGKAEKILPKLTQTLRNCADVVAVVNPARAGLHPSVIQTIRQCEAINKLIYISCKPDGFAMENFVSLGSTRSTGVKKDHSAPFVPRYAVPVDMFPHTDHVELVLLFDRVTN
ncbi:tRNA (uracil(54)-C(5))-methyltransferase homolog [Homarus americanus]|uniref:tRNA (Uracil(54)-C(5))-methyltransferase-like n=1 Tax=Homarus americanus TaxID=6706 RepID=A0A8J5MX19_HOMAM|nr:tRNA (uracil(54)-C(5))-methyltransferase homolog [Homarus americanus]KAG7167660.1 tRNA (uracil(54)-C(5))-methyltransferase-like [Homarus americanus]